MEEVEFVDMVHPDVDVSAQATREAFEQVWQARGWQIQHKPDAPAIPAPKAPVPPTPPVTSNPSEEVK